MIKFLKFVPFVLFVFISWNAEAWGQAKTSKQKKGDEKVTLKDLFPKKSLFGPRASSTAFSYDGKFAAFLYRPYNERRHGSDLWIYDFQKKKLERITNVLMMGRVSKVRSGSERRTVESGQEVIGEKQERRQEKRRQEKKTTRQMRLRRKRNRNKKSWSLMRKTQTTKKANVIPAFHLSNGTRRKIECWLSRKAMFTK